MTNVPRRLPLSHNATIRRQPRSHTTDLWHKCAGCGELAFIKQWKANDKVCPSCGKHEHLAAHEWIALLLDPGSWREHDADIASSDPLAFVAPHEMYAAKLSSLQASLDLLDAVVCGEGTIENLPLELCVHDFAFLADSMGTVVGEKLARSAERAVERRVPLVTINASGGARMHEGIFSLMQMAKVSVALARLAQVGRPHISVLTDPCYGGVLAAHASSADVLLAEPHARIGFAGRRVIQQTTGEELPASFQTAEFLLAHGLIDMVTPRASLRQVIGRFLYLYG